jgi:transposase
MTLTTSGRNRCNRRPGSEPVQSVAARKPRLDKALYKERHLIECCFNKLKQFRRIATRYEKAASAFLAMITVAAIALWLR